MYKFNKKDVFSFSNVDEARHYKGQECYFEDSYAGLQYCIDNDIKGVLKDISKFDEDPVECTFRADRDIEVMNSREISAFGLCLPCNLVKKQEYRPLLNAAEFEAVVGEIGSIIIFSEKIYNLTKRAIVTGITSHGDSVVFSLGASTYTPRELFEGYILIKNGEEVPFGVKD